MADDLRRLVDEDEIRDVMQRYARGVDRREWELVRATFFEDGHDDHADFSGTRDDLSRRSTVPAVFPETAIWRAGLGIHGSSISEAAENKSRILRACPMTSEE